MGPGGKVGTSESVSGKPPSNDWCSFRRAAQKKCRRTVPAGQWDACIRLSRTRCPTSGNEFGPHNTRWSRPRTASWKGLTLLGDRAIFPGSARLLNMVVRRIVDYKKL